MGSSYELKGTKTFSDALNSTLKAQFGTYNFESAVRQLRKDDGVYEIKSKNGEASNLLLLTDENGDILKQKAGLLRHGLKIIFSFFHYLIPEEDYQYYE